MEFIKKNKFIIIAIAVFLIFILLLVQVKNIFFPSDGNNAAYGDRLKGESAVKLSEKEKKQLKDHLESEAGVSGTSVTVKGKIINIILTVNEDVGPDTAKAIADKSIEKISKEQLNYYDVQIFVKKDSEATNFPIIGYRHASKEGFSWTKDRA